MSTAINAAVFAVTFFLTARFFRRDGRWALHNGRPAFRYFTVLSNVLCAAAALLMCVAPNCRWVWLLKYVGTAAVTVTLLTVFLFLGPTLGYGKLLKGGDLFMHLLTPLLAVASFGFLEKRGMRFAEALWGLLPVALYGVWYLYKVVLAPQHRRWDDFYGFNRGGRWPLSFAAMQLGSFAVCMGLMALQNL